MVAPLAAELEAAGVRLSVRNGALAANGPRAVMTPERVAIIRANRTALLAWLAAPASVDESAEPQRQAAVRIAGAAVIVTGLDRTSIHRVMVALASHHWKPVRNVAARHDYAGGTLILAASEPEITRRVATVVRPALALPEPTGAESGGTGA